MYTLSMEQRITVLSALVEGNSIRSIERMIGIHRDTIMRLLVSTGNHCLDLLDQRIRHIETKRIQLDELWTFVQMK